jgi:hypothetical protein
MPALSHRFVVFMLPLAIASGCFGTKAPTSSTTRLRPNTLASIATSVKATANPPVAPASVSRLGTTPSKAPATSRPSPTPSPTPAASLAPAYPAVAAQPVTINPSADDAGTLGLEPQSFVVLGMANVTAGTNIRLSSAEEKGYRLTSLAEPDAHGGPPDAHARWRQHEARQPLPPYTPSYGLQQAATPLAKGANVDFYVITSFDNDKYEDVKVTARVAEVGQHCYVVIDKGADRTASETTKLNQRAKTIATTFDTQIYPTNTQIFGAEPNPGVDKDARLFILLSPAVGNYGTDNTLGFFAQRDEFPARTDGQAIYKHSNAKEMLYVSSRIVLSGAVDDYMGTIAHEFQHMINFNQKVLIPWSKAADSSKLKSEDLWIDEGMAMYAIEANGYGLKAGGQVLENHVKKFQQEPASYSLTQWDGNPDQSGYGAVYLFMDYLADRFGEDIIREIVANPRIGATNLDAVLRPRGTTFNRVFHDWCLANVLDPLPQNVDPIYQYDSLNMVGTNGKTRLVGFTSETLGMPGTTSLTSRPYSLRIFDLPPGPTVPRFTVEGLSDAGTVSRLVLPR